ncbi:response regulator [Streptococcus pneumoniae]|nr:response regulator [Streptococcus pneumoniae]
MKVLILEDVIEHQVRLERILDEISKRIFQYHTRQREKSVNLKNTLKMMK